MLAHHRNGLILALSLMSILPAGKKQLSEQDFAQAQSLSLIYYPVVGLILAVISLVFFALILFGQVHFVSWSASISAAIALLFWVGLTGAIHIDGFADSIDAMAASHKLAFAEDRQTRVLAIFKDPCCGPMAVCALVLLLLIKYALLQSIFLNIPKYLAQPAHIFAYCAGFCLVWITPRIVTVLYIQNTPYARKNGLASGLNPQRTYSQLLLFLLTILPPITCIIENTPTLIGVSALSTGLVFSLVLLWLWRRLWLAAISGYTGDTVGSLIELNELLLLFVLVICIY